MNTGVSTSKPGRPPRRGGRRSSSRRGSPAATRPASAASVSAERVSASPAPGRAPGESQRQGHGRVRKQAEAGESTGDQDHAGRRARGRSKSDPGDASGAAASAQIGVTVTAAAAAIGLSRQPSISKTMPENNQETKYILNKGRFQLDEVANELYIISHKRVLGTTPRLARTSGAGADTGCRSARFRMPRFQATRGQAGRRRTNGTLCPTCTLSRSRKTAE